METKMELSVSYYPVLRVILSSLMIYYRGTTWNVPGQRTGVGFGSLPLTLRWQRVISVPKNLSLDNIHKDV